MPPQAGTTHGVCHRAQNRNAPKTTGRLNNKHNTPHPPNTHTPNNWHLVIESKLALRHAAEVRPHLERADHFGAHDVAVAVDQEIDRLHHVQEHLVLLVKQPL